jgi:YVTN family beta-propeller protein
MIAALEMAKAPSSLYFSGDGRRLFVTNANANELSTVDVASRKILTVVPIGTDPDGIIWSAR